MNLRLLSFSLVALLGVVSIFETRLAVFSFLLLVIACAALTRFDHPKKHLLRIALALGIVASAVGLFRFIRLEALPGIVDARGRASSTRAVSFLRELLFAEDALRRYAPLDPDRDGVGSAGLLGELTGEVGQGASPLRKIDLPPLAPRHAPKIETRSGPALELEGYLFLVCLPTEGGGFSARPGDSFDEEQSERRWLAYAWPARDDGVLASSYVIDEHERILESDNREHGRLRHVGPLASPPCDDALASSSAEHYRPWRGKTPRASLPGDL